MRTFHYYIAIAYVVVLTAYISLANDSIAWDKVYFINQLAIIGGFSLFIWLREIKRGRRAFFLSLSVFQLLMIAYNIVDWRGKFELNYYLSLGFCFTLLCIFLIAIHYDRKVKG